MGKLILILILGLAPVLASCNADSASTATAEGSCSAEAAQSLVGKPKPTDGEAMRITHSKAVRQIEPNQPVTHDFQEDRVTIETDPASARVVGARCG
jgi:hypothetical protein